MEESSIEEGAQDSTEELICPLCTDIYKNPKVLPCLHNFCEQCLHKYILFTVRETSKQTREFSCPVCRMPVRSYGQNVNIDTWSTNMKSNLIIGKSLSSTEETHVCIACKRDGELSAAQIWCDVCEELLCTECEKMHRKMKLSSSHIVTPIGNMKTNISGIDLQGISGKCLVHPLNNIELFCYDHKQECCTLCVALKHRICRKVKEIVKIETDFDQVKRKLSEIKEAASAIVTKRVEQRCKFTTEIENIEEKARTSITDVKRKLDKELEKFLKSLHVFRDEYYTKYNRIQRLFEQFAKNLEHWNSALNLLSKSCIQTQTFIYTESIKKEIYSRVEELQKCVQDDSLEDVHLEMSKITSLLGNCNDLLSFNSYEMPVVGQGSELVSCCASLGLNCYPKFGNIDLKHVKTLCYPSTDVQCGTCLKDEFIAVGSRHCGNSLLVINKFSGELLSEIYFEGDCKRICCNESNSRLFISCYNQEMYSANVHKDQIHPPTKVERVNDFVGGLDAYKKYLYFCIDNSVTKLRIDSESVHTETVYNCFTANVCRGLGGLKVLGKYIIFITEDKRIKCTDETGNEKFTYNSEEIENPINIVVLPSGLIIVLDSQNGLHVISENGNRSRLLLNGSEIISNPKDIWLDINNELIYIAGGQNIAVYQIKTSST